MQNKFEQRKERAADDSATQADKKAKRVRRQAKKQQQQQSPAEKVIPQLLPAVVEGLPAALDVWPSLEVDISDGLALVSGSVVSAL